MSHNLEAPSKDIDWVDAAMRMDGAVAVAEARVSAQAKVVLEVAERGEDTIVEAALLQKHERSLALRRGVQAYLIKRLLNEYGRI